MPAAEDLGTVIAGFLAGAEAGTVLAPAGRPYTRAEVRELRGALSHVSSSDLGSHGVDAVSSGDVGSLIDALRAEGLPPSRVGAIVDALRSVFAYAIGRGLVISSPLIGLAPLTPEGPSPTTAVVALGETLVTWTVRLIALAFVLVAVGLAVALA
jgi:hypothetical protein